MEVSLIRYTRLVFVHRMQKSWKLSIAAVFGTIVLFIWLSITDVNQFIGDEKLTPSVQPTTTEIKQSHDLAIWTRDSRDWLPNSTLCVSRPTKFTADLKSPAGNLSMFIYNPAKDIWISRAIVNTGMFDSDKIKNVVQILKEDEQLDFLDIGSNIGVYSLTAAKLGRRVLAVDALVFNIRNLCASVRMNGLNERIHMVLNAISNERKVVELGVDKRNMGGTFVDDHADYIKKVKGRTVNGAHYSAIQTIEMDDLLKLPFMPKFRRIFMKMDIEGFEARAIEKANWMFNSLDIRFVLMEWIFHRNKASGHSICKFMNMHNMLPWHPINLTPLPTSIAGNWAVQDVLWAKDVND